MKKWLFSLVFFVSSCYVHAQQLAPVPPMGWMSWNYFADKINEKDLREMADAMEQSGMVKAGYRFLMIDDGWQGGRDNRNAIIPDPAKFPSGIKALADYLHQKGIKLGIYSDAAPLTCAGYTASLHFEEQDAATFASWGVDYLKYDYCNAPTDSNTAKLRYKAMANALRKSGRYIVFSICEWGDRKPWLWAANAGGQLWRTTGDVRDKWQRAPGEKSGEGLMEILDVNAELSDYAGPGRWNDPDMLIVGLYGKKGPSGDLGGIGCNDIEYASNMSLWCMMNAPLVVTCDVRHMNDITKRILLNEEVIAVNQDPLGKQAIRKIKGDQWNVLVKPLANGDYAVAVLNRGTEAAIYSLLLQEIGLSGKYEIRDLWQHQVVTSGNKWKGKILSHETRLFRLKKV
ncbi:glycoside hydrolase family 27 protein [Chitinophaga sp. 22321]|uniref:Alpha-galactosidase n=1 Tax=Chitinophaga hostae TaxID=2831022 RepID=A0ABS5IXF4_9BACT|nr:glycoside hydrolase family 27 protein [Chitinophaga hostae]MBS0027648.1 glycoside hydrolase family 27 protein [Chitinophaga hostae]